MSDWNNTIPEPKESPSALAERLFKKSEPQKREGRIFPEELVKIPDNVFAIPANHVSVTQAASKIFRVIGEREGLFIRENNVTEVIPGKDSDYLEQVAPERFCSLVERFGYRIGRLEKKKDEKYAWRTQTFPMNQAKLLLNTDEAREHLPPIRQLVNCPVLTPYGEVLERGYHRHDGGTFVSTGNQIVSIPFEQSVGLLRDILGDFDFASPSDESRAFASLVSPALKMGGWINDDFPLDMAEADKSQSGKTFRQKLVCRIYNEEPSSITMDSGGGVGSLDEKISTALLRGRPFVTLGNMRGKIESQTMEEAIRGAGRVHCRGFRKDGHVDCTPFMWQLSTNGAEFTTDLANRTIITKIRKQPEGYQWREYDEGNLEAHVIKNQALYLSCVFSVLKEWKKKGRPKTRESRHDFKGWCQSMDGIVQMCGFPPLLDGHVEEQKRTANPNLQWLREVCLVLPERDLGCKLTTLRLAEHAEDNGIEFPNNGRDEAYIKAGRLLGKLYRDAESDIIEVDKFVVTREVIRLAENDYNETKQYTITKK